MHDINDGWRHYQRRLDYISSKYYIRDKFAGLLKLMKRRRLGQKTPAAAATTKLQPPPAVPNGSASDFQWWLRYLRHWVAGAGASYVVEPSQERLQGFNEEAERSRLAVLAAVETSRLEAREAAESAAALETSAANWTPWVFPGLK